MCVDAVVRYACGCECGKKKVYAADAGAGEKARSFCFFSCRGVFG